MKITPFKNTFKGHGAGKIKALYMQNANLPSQIAVYDELKSIGYKHNFDVFIQSKEGILSQEMKYPSSLHCDYEIWSQDNKTILNKNGQTVIISGLYMPHTERTATKAFAEEKGINHEKVELFVRGGNLFVGKKPDGENYLIIGHNDIKVSAIHHFLKEKLGYVDYYYMQEFMDDGQIEIDGEIIATLEEFSQYFKANADFIVQKFLETFDVKKENMTILPQGQYHNDLAIRPLNYPYILVNDEKMSKENLKKLKKFYKFDISTRKFVKSHFEKIKNQKEIYTSCDELCKHLEKVGFIPIRIGGGYGLETINFMNAIVHQDGENLIYITNSGISKDKNYIFLQTLFEQELKKKCPQISKIYFVKGAPTDKGSNVILEYLKQHHGGIHCLCAEEMWE